MVLELKDLTCEERFKEMEPSALKERRDRRNMITIFKLTNNLEEVDRKKLYF